MSYMSLHCSCARRILSIWYDFGYVAVLGSPSRDARSVSPDAVRMVNTPSRLIGWERSSLTDASIRAEASQVSVELAENC